jgi:hypothetical protein
MTLRVKNRFWQKHIKIIKFWSFLLIDNKIWIIASYPKKLSIFRADKLLGFTVENTVEVGFAVKNKFNLVEKTLKTENYYLQKH